MNKLFRTLAATGILALIPILTLFSTSALATETKSILATTFPIYQLVRHIIQDRNGYHADLMIPSQLGCPHDYALTPQDMKKIAAADILIINGLGMEEFMGAPLEKANPTITIIDSSAGIQETMDYFDRHEDEELHQDATSHAHENASHAHEENHHHHGINPHLFASPRMAALLTQNIASQLATIDPEGATLYKKNAQAYAARLNQIADDLQSLGTRLANTRIVEPHGVFDYLARDTGLTIIAVMQAHGQEPSAAEMLHLVSQIRREKAGAIFTEPQYPAKAGETLARETGIPVAVLDPVATGPENAPLDYYETVMQKNMQTLERVLGSK